MSLDDYERCEHGLRIGLDDCEKCSLIGLRAQLKWAMKERLELKQRIAELEQKNLGLYQMVARFTGNA